MRDFIPVIPAKAISNKVNCKTLARLLKRCALYTSCFKNRCALYTSYPRVEKQLKIMAQPSLPDDIISTNILPRLDVKSLTRFRSVCKSWNSLFSNPCFAKDHLYFTAQNPENDTLIFNKLAYGYDEFGSITSSHPGDIALLSLPDLSETSLLDVISSELHMLGSVNGLVCLVVHELDQFIVWNPAIRRAMKINSPVENFTLPYATRKFYGFCWDAAENDFKVVTSYYKMGNLGNLDAHLSLYIYSCNLGSWSSPRDSMFTKAWWDGHRFPSAIVTGEPYWAYSWYKGTQWLFKFDIRSGDFREVPELYLFDRRKYVIVVNLKERLSALVYDFDRANYSLADVHCFDEGLGVWSKMYNVMPVNCDMFSCGWSYNLYNVRESGHLWGCFKHGGEIVFSANRKFRCYDHKTNKITDLQNQEGYTEKCFSYEESLIFLEGMKPQHQVEPTLWK